MTRTASNRWDAGQTLAREILHGLVLDASEPDADFVRSYSEILLDSSLDEAFRALMLEFPPESDLQRSLSETGEAADPSAVRDAFDALRNAIAGQLADRLEGRYRALADDAPYTPDARSTGRRSLRNAFLRLLTRLDGGKAATEQYVNADNMTERIGALRSLLAIEKGEVELQSFLQDWSGDRLVLDKWFALQILEAPPARAPALVRELTEHKDFDWRNPNRFRSVIATFAFANHAGFHAVDGSGYKFTADWLIKMDRKNPQVAARHCAAFGGWRHYDADRQRKMRRQMERIRAAERVSGDSAEMLDRLLKPGSAAAPGDALSPRMGGAMGIGSGSARLHLESDTDE